MTDIVIPLGFAYIPENTNNMLGDYGELKYCLRSIEKHLKNVGNIYLIGTNMPSWGTGLFQIICGDKTGKENKEWNIYNKIKVACAVNDVSNDFLFMNDDHYLTQDFDADYFPYYYDQTIGDGYVNRPSTYQTTRRNTGDAIGAGAKYFDVHSPIRYNKRLFEKVMRYDWDKPFGYCIKSLYGYVNNIEGHQQQDLKIPAVVSEHWLSVFMPDKPFFSTSDNCWNENGALLRMMDELYPKKSKWEK